MAGPGGKEVARVSVRVVPDTSNTEADTKVALERIERRLQINVTVKPDTATATVEMQRFQRDWNGKQVTLDVDARTAGATAHLDEFRRPRSLEVNVDVNTSKAIAQMGAFIATFTGLRAGGGLLQDIGRVFTNTLNDLPKVAAIAVGIAAIGSAAITAAGGVASLGASLVSVASLSALLPAALGGLVAVVATLAFAFSGVGKSLASPTSGGGVSLAQQSRQLQAAEVSLSRAQRDAVDAQNALTQAREDAAKALRDLSNQVVDAQLDQRQSVLDLASAQQNYNAVLANPSASATQREQASITFEQAKQQLLEQTQRVSDLQEQQQKANAAGVDGAQNVVQATERVADAQQSIVAAQNQVLDLHEKSGGAAAVAYGKLSSGAQAAVQALRKVKSELAGVRTEIQNDFFAGFGPALLAASAVIVPQLKTGLGTLAGSLGQTVQGLLGQLSKSLGGGVLDRLLTATASGIDALAPGLNAAVAALTSLGVVGTGFLPQIGAELSDVLTRFSAFLAKAETDGSLQQFITNGITALGQLASALSSTGSIISGIFGALSSSTGGMGAFAGLLASIAAVVNSPGFQTTMATIFSGAAAGAKGLEVALGPIGGMLSSLAPLLAQILSEAGQTVGTLLTDIASAVASPAFQDGLSGFFSGVEQGLLAIGPALPSLAQAFGELGQYAGQLGAQLGPVLAQAIISLAPVVVQLLQALIPLVPPIAQLAIELFPQIAQTLLLLTPIVAGLIQFGLVPLLQLIGDIVNSGNASVAMFQAVMGGMSGVGVVTDIVSGKFGVWAQVIGQSLLTVIRGFQDFFGVIANLSKGSAQFLVDAWGNAVNGIIDLVNGLVVGLNAALAGVKAISGGTINLQVGKIPRVAIPKLATGADVLYRPGGTLAVLGEQTDERVVDRGAANRSLELQNALSRGVLARLAQPAFADGMQITGTLDLGNGLTGFIDGRIQDHSNQIATGISTGKQKGSL